MVKHGATTMNKRKAQLTKALPPPPKWLAWIVSPRVGVYGQLGECLALLRLDLIPLPLHLLTLTKKS